MKPFLPVLSYQKIGRAPKNSRLKKEWASVRRLEKMLPWLIKHGYTFITPADLQKELPAKPILLAFMGGYQSFYTHIFPLLQQHKICATLFLAVDTLGTYNSWQDPYKEPWQNIITDKQLKEMHKSGLVQIGTLGLDGHNLLKDAPTSAQQTILESIHRLKMLYKIDACAVAFWPSAKGPHKRAMAIGGGLNLPVLTSQPGKNALNEKKFLYILPLPAQSSSRRLERSFTRIRTAGSWYPPHPEREIKRIPR